MRFTDISPSVGSLPSAPWFAARPITLALILGLFVFAAGCKKVHRTDTTPLDGVGLSYSSIQDLRGLNLTDAEVAELVKAKHAGISDPGCVELVRIARSRNRPFADGDAISSLREVGMSEDNVLELARLNQLGLQAGEEQAMRLAGLSDAVVLALAHRRAEGKPALSGAALAELKNTGMSEPAILTLLDRGISDEQVNAIIVQKQRRATDAQILARYPGR
jgi:hypothetical protein